MKKWITVALLMGLMLIAFLGCDKNASDKDVSDSTRDSVTETTSESIDKGTSEDAELEESVWDIITSEDGEYYLTLPKTQQKMKITEYIQYFDEIDLETVKSAEEGVIEQVAQYSEESNYYFQLYLDEQDVLWLREEVIVKYETKIPNRGGCGIDHDHVFLSEALTKTADEEQPHLLARNDGVVNVNVSTLPYSVNYSYSDVDAKRIVDYLSNLTLKSEFPENPDEYGGMTWVIELEYEDASVVTVYIFGGMFACSDSNPWYRMEGEEAQYFETIIEELNSK